MRGRNTIFINGQHYDAATGLPVEPLAPAAKPGRAIQTPKNVISDFSPAKSQALPAARPAAAEPVQKKPAAPAEKPVNRAVPVKPKAKATQRSMTLRREAVKRPVGTYEASKASLRPERAARSVVSRSPMISKFAAHPQPRVANQASVLAQDTANVSAAKKPVTAPIAKKPVTKAPTKPAAAVAQAHAKVAAKKPVPARKPAALSSRELKEKLIAEKLASIEHAKQSTAKTKDKRLALKPRAASVIAACAALVMLGGYLTYLNMPNISVRVAAAQAGIDAKFPEYRPDGYRFSGPIAYAPGEVTVKFTANGSDKSYEIKQKSSSWDSQAVLDNFVSKQADSYLTYSEQGLTIYTFDNKAAWVNGGILYTINGNAPLSNDQVLRIAASL